MLSCPPTAGLFSAVEQLLLFYFCFSCFSSPFVCPVSRLAVVGDRLLFSAPFDPSYAAEIICTSDPCSFDVTDSFAQSFEGQPTAENLYLYTREQEIRMSDAKWR